MPPKKRRAADSDSGSDSDSDLAGAMGRMQVDQRKGGGKAKGGQARPKRFVFRVAMGMVGPLAEDMDERELTGYFESGLEAAVRAAQRDGVGATYDDHRVLNFRVGAAKAALEVGVQIGARDIVEARTLASYLGEPEYYLAANHQLFEGDDAPDLDVDARLLDRGQEM